MQALKLYEQNYSHDELMELLGGGNIVQRQIAALRLDGVYSNSDAAVLLDNLTGQDGKIREAVALRLNEFMADKETVKFFCQKQFYDVFLAAVVDINANICRNVINAISNLRDDEEFCGYFCAKLSGLIFELLDKIEKFDFQEGKYKVNKEVFKLYWCLEAVYVFYDKVEFSDLKQIILRSKDIPEYTIREKVAKILTRDFEDTDLLNARDCLKNDENYYVRILIDRY